jgi:hypothetical protein
MPKGEHLWTRAKVNASCANGTHATKASSGLGVLGSGMWSAPAAAHANAMTGNVTAIGNRMLPPFEPRPAPDAD